VKARSLSHDVVVAEIIPALLENLLMPLDTVKPLVYGSLFSIACFTTTRSSPSAAIASAYARSVAAV
jgi:hypothetical protein